MFCKKDVLKNFAKFTGKHLYESLFLNKVAGLRPRSFLDSGTSAFLWALQGFYEHLFLQNTSGGCFCFEKTFRVGSVIIYWRNKPAFWITFTFSENFSGLKKMASSLMETFYNQMPLYIFWVLTNSPFSRVLQLVFTKVWFKISDFL